MLQIIQHDTEVGQKDYKLDQMSRENAELKAKNKDLSGENKELEKGLREIHKAIKEHGKGGRLVVIVLTIILRSYNESFKEMGFIIITTEDFIECKTEMDTLKCLSLRNDSPRAEMGQNPKALET